MNQIKKQLDLCVKKEAVPSEFAASENDKTACIVLVQLALYAGFKNKKPFHILRDKNGAHRIFKTAQAAREWIDRESGFLLQELGTGESGSRKYEVWSNC